jgi:hypothetical protein
MLPSLEALTLALTSTPDSELVDSVAAVAASLPGLEAVSVLAVSTGPGVRALDSGEAAGFAHAETTRAPRSKSVFERVIRGQRLLRPAR